MTPELGSADQSIDAVSRTTRLHPSTRTTHTNIYIYIYAKLNHSLSALNFKNNVWNGLFSVTCKLWLGSQVNYNLIWINMIEESSYPILITESVPYSI